MRKSVALAVAVAGLMVQAGEVLAGAASTQPSVEAVPMAPGWQFKVRRIAQVDGQITVGTDQKFPLKFVRDLRFDETVVKVDDGKATEIGRLIEQASLQQTDPETGKESAETLAKKGDLFKVTFVGLSSTVSPAKDGVVATERIREALPDRLTHDLLPDGPLEKGQSWTFKGPEVSHRFQSLSFQGGQVHLKVTDVQTEPETGTQYAKIEGTIKTSLEMEPQTATLQGKLLLYVPLRIGVPALVLEGTLTSQGTLTTEDGQQVPITLKAKASYIQTVKPSQTVTEAVK